MANPTLRRWPALPSLLLPPIDDLRSLSRTPEPLHVPQHESLGSFTTRTRSWFRFPEELPGRVTVALWLVLVGAGTVGAWSIAGAAPDGGLVYRIAMLGHPGLVLTLAAVCVTVLLALAPFTRGLTRAGGPELVAMVVGGGAGVGALVGVAALALLTAVAGFLTLAIIIVAFERS